MSHRKSEGPPRYYTTNEVAVAFGVSMPTVVNWIEAGLLAAHKTLGGHRRIAHGEVVRFARERELPVPLDSSVDDRNRVLVVDDEVDFSDMVREYLAGRGGYEVGVANSGFAAGQEVERFRPDVIVMDLMMDDLNGFEAHARLRGDPKTAHIPVIACTGYRDPEVDRRIRAAAFDGFIEKPLKLDALLELIRSLLAR